MNSRRLSAAFNSVGIINCFFVKITWFHQRYFCYSSTLFLPIINIYLLYNKSFIIYIVLLVTAPIKTANNLYNKLQSFQKLLDFNALLQVPIKCLISLILTFTSFVVAFFLISFIYVNYEIMFWYAHRTLQHTIFCILFVSKHLSHLN